MIPVREIRVRLATSLDDPRDETMNFEDVHSCFVKTSWELKPSQKYDQE